METIHITKKLDNFEIYEIKHKNKIETLCCDDDLEIVNTRSSQRYLKQDGEFAPNIFHRYEHMVICNKCKKTYLIRYKYSASNKVDYIDDMLFESLNGMTVKEIYEYFLSRRKPLASSTIPALLIETDDFEICLREHSEDDEETIIEYIAFNKAFLDQALADES